MKHNDLCVKAGPRQKLILIELEKRCEIVLLREDGLWAREAYTSRLAKNLIRPSDKTVHEKIREIDKKIKDLEPVILRLEKEAEILGVKLDGGARARLLSLKNEKKELEENQ